MSEFFLKSISFLFYGYVFSYPSKDITVFCFLTNLCFFRVASLIFVCFGLSFMLELFFRYLVSLDYLLLYKSKSPGNWSERSQPSSGAPQLRASQTQPVSGGSLPSLPQWYLWICPVSQGRFHREQSPKLLPEGYRPDCHFSYLVNNLKAF